jgi:hypothetical protein
MPLFIPVILGAAAFAASRYGLKKGYKGVSAMRRAKAVGERAERRYKNSIARLEAARDHLAQKSAETHALRLEIARTTLGRMAELLQAIERQGSVHTPEELERIGVQPEQVRGFVAQYLEAGGTLKGAVSALGAGAGASAATTGLVASLATASAGTAISSLSGAAAQGAILAWLGGGSPAAGGWGMAGGALVLGGITVAPVIAIGGFVLAAQGEKALTKALRYRAKVNKAVASIQTAIALHRRAEERADELQGVMKRLDERASARLEELIANVDAFDDRNDEDISRLSTVKRLCEALNELLHTRLIDNGEQLNQASVELIMSCCFPVEDAWAREAA